MLPKKNLKGTQQILEGSRAIALTVKNINPAVVSAYPITPQTHIVEDLAKFKADGLADYEYSRAESEFAAASIILGASAAGARTYSATSSQGLLLMTEVLYNIAGLRLPIVMTCANRAISAPINIWCDHSDIMTIRDAGWIQLFAANHQEAVDQHILAYKLAESLHIPVMVNVDGFILTHSYEPVIIPDIKTVKKFLPDYRPENGTYLNPESPVSLGTFFTPAYYMETRETLHNDLLSSLEMINKEYKSWQKIFSTKKEPGHSFGAGSFANGLVEYYGPKKPTTILVAMGSVIGTILETVKNIKQNSSIGVLKIKTYRPFPGEEINNLISKAKNVAVIEKAISLGQAGPLYTEIKTGLINKNLNIKDYIVGLGGRDITEAMIAEIIKDSSRPKPRGLKQDIACKFIGKI